MLVSTVTSIKAGESDEPLSIFLDDRGMIGHPVQGCHVIET